MKKKFIRIIPVPREEPPPGPARKIVLVPREEPPPGPARKIVLVPREEPPPGPACRIITVPRYDGADTTLPPSRPSPTPPEPFQPVKLVTKRKIILEDLKGSKS
jgi:hypothetical protein